MADPSPNRVLFVDQSGALGGAELSLADIVCRRRVGGAEGDSVVLFDDGPFGDRLRRDGATVEVMSLGVDVQKASGALQQLLASPRVLGLARRLAQAARKHDVIYANTQKAAVVGAIAARMAKRPLIWHLRDMLDAGHFSRANRAAAVWLTNRTAVRVICNSQATADAYHWAGGRVDASVVHNGVDPAPFDAVSDSQALAARQAIDVPEGAPLVGVFGRLTPWKGQHVLLTALESEALSGAHAAIVGEALFTDEDRAYASDLRGRTSGGPLAGRVHWLGQRDDVPVLMRACDLVVHCSTQPEPFGRVIVEGMLAGKPVTASNAGGAAEILKDGRTGRLTPPCDANRLAEALADLLRDPQRAAQIAAAGRQAALERFSLDSCVDAINAVIASALKKR